MGILVLSLWTIPTLVWSQPVPPVSDNFPTIPAIVPDAPKLIDEENWEQILERLEAAESRLIELESQDLSETLKPLEPPSKPKSKSWFEKYKLSGYKQLRINETLSRDDGSAPAHHTGDGSIGENQSFIIRRARLVFQSDMTDRISLYFQPDFASNVPGSPDNNQFTQIRDLYADIHFDVEKVFRVRVGQSKVPYGWENLQSSRNRLPLDRNDALNSTVKNERDLGAFFYWTPQSAQEFFEKTAADNLKGSGNYGVFGIGVYNGQGGSLREQNDNLHLVARVTLPFEFADGQLMEVGIQGYTGRYTVLSSAISPLGVGPAVRPLGTLETGNVRGIRDDRLAGTIVYYPQPFGFQAEWTVGRGPALNEAQTAVEEQSLYGGYAMFIYHHESKCYGNFFPFVRWTYYNGGYKSERNAPFAEIDEWELGLEWQISKALEIVGMYTITDRTNTRALSTANALSYRQFEGDLLRFQLQFKY